MERQDKIEEIRELKAGLSSVNTECQLKAEKLRAAYKTAKYLADDARRKEEACDALLRDLEDTNKTPDMTIASLKPAFVDHTVGPDSGFTDNTSDHILPFQHDHHQWPTVVESEEGLWMEIKCPICGGNAVPAGGPKSKLRFLKGVGGMRRHLWDAHRKKYRSNAILRVAYSRSLTAKEVYNLNFKHTKDHWEVHGVRCFSPERDFRSNDNTEPIDVPNPIKAKKITRTTPSPTSEEERLREDLIPEYPDPTHPDGSVQPPPWYPTLVKAASGNYRDLKCCICGANSWRYEDGTEMFFTLRGTRGLLAMYHHVRHDHKLNMPPYWREELLEKCANGTYTQADVLKMWDEGEHVLSLTSAHLGSATFTVLYMRNTILNVQCLERAATTRIDDL
ncbi:hypothetical protein BU16DRAFT_558973 [Lophium mytilinum]|uniref:Uncharacterized protein n=1 Tax=Lophium mytilinum TaxID=390894 RepID=A0A6A6R3P8_9PEZI|nr:hypothetical protein BU16DRAFT_558973 [Lophium mytilinum]